MKQDLPPDSASPKRRAIVAGLGVGVCAAVVGVLRWPWSHSPETAVAPAGSKPVAATTMAPGETALPAAAVPAVPGAKMSREWFAPHLNSRFAVATDSGDLSVKLVEITPAKTLKGGAVTYTAFALEFEGPPAASGEARIYSIRHEALGEMELFLSPVGSYKDRTRYEAAFTQRV